MSEAVTSGEAPSGLPLKDSVIGSGVSSEDITGRDRLVSNVLFSWGSQLVYLVAGFIMPHMIDRRLGQDVLGIWDFCWSLTGYFRLLELGVTSSVNPYVAKYWGKRDVAGVNRIFNSATLVLAVVGAVVLLLTFAFAAALPAWFGHRLNGHMLMAQGTVLCLGAGLALQTALGGFNGVLTGCHQWKLQSLRLGFWQMVSVTGMLIALWLGGNLLVLAAITFVAQAFGQLTMVTLAYRTCDGLTLKRSFVQWSTIKELYHYGAKTLVPNVSSMLLNQTTSLLIVAYLGPSALAVFSRPRSLLFQLDSLERKMAMILIPTTSSLESAGNLNEIRTLLLKSVRYSISLVLPIALILIVFGGKVMWLWMGPRYANGTVPAILTIGFLSACVQTPILYMLGGLNAHGRGGIAQFIASACSALFLFLAFRCFSVGLTTAALAVTVPLMIVNLGYLPRQACRQLDLDLWQFVRSVTIGPMLDVLPFALCLVVARLTFDSHHLVSLSLILAGAIMLAIRYWRRVLPFRLKAAVLGLIARMVPINLASLQTKADSDQSDIQSALPAEHPVPENAGAPVK